MCIPSSTISKTNCRSTQQVAAAAHQIARSATSFGVSEIVVYSTEKTSQEEEAAALTNTPADKPKKIVFGDDDDDDNKNGDKEDGKSADKDNSSGDELSEQDLLVGFLEYFVTPSYLRKSLFGEKLHVFEGPAQKLPKLTGLPYLNHGSSRYFIGLSVQRRIPGSKQRKTVSANGRRRKRKTNKNDANKDNDPSVTGYVNIGFKKVMKLSDNAKVPVNSIVVVDKETGAVVSPELAFGPKASKKENKDGNKKGEFKTEFETSNPTWTKQGFAYKVRKVGNFGKVFTESPYPSGYRYTALAPCMEYFSDAVGTSMDSSKQQKSAEQALSEIAVIEEETFLIKGITTTPGEDIPILLVLGKWSELEQTILSDGQELAGLEKAQMIFDGRLRMGRGSRVEDATLIALSKIEGL